MKEVIKVFFYNDFSPEQNKMIRKEEKICTRKLTMEEKAIIKKRKTFTLLSFISFISIVASVVLSVSLGATSSPWFGLLILTIIPFLWLLNFSFDKSSECEEKISHFNDWGFEIEQLIWEQHYDEQMQKMTEWRKAHPLEEAVRKAQESRSCVDIVEAARLYAEQYFKGVL